MQYQMDFFKYVVPTLSITLFLAMQATYRGDIKLIEDFFLHQPINQLSPPQDFFDLPHGELVTLISMGASQYVYLVFIMNF